MSVNITAPFDIPAGMPLTLKFVSNRQGVTVSIEKTMMDKATNTGISKQITLPVKPSFFVNLGEDDAGKNIIDNR